MAGCKFVEGINDYRQGERRYVAIVADHRGVCKGVWQMREDIPSWDISPVF